MSFANFFPKFSVSGIWVGEVWGGKRRVHAGAHNCASEMETCVYLPAATEMFATPDKYYGKTSVAEHLRGMWPAPSSQNDTLMLRENSNFKTIN